MCLMIGNYGFKTETPGNVEITDVLHYEMLFESYVKGCW